MYLSHAAKRRRATKALNATITALQNKLVNTEGILARGLAANKEYEANEGRLRAALNNAQAQVKEQAASIALFKTEALASATTIAAMQGYIDRTLEDDRVREQPKIDAPADSVTTTTVQCQPKHQEPMRSGPSVVSAQAIRSASYDSIGAIALTDHRNWTSEEKKPVPTQWVHR